MSCHCNDFSRTEALRRAAAQARGSLRGWEPGMPAPAGTGLDRRQFLFRGAGLVLSVYGAGKLGLAAFEEGVARAAGPNDPVLVSIFLAGGIDSITVLAPVGDPRYRSLRPRLAVPDSAGPAFAEDSRLHWHPDAAALAQLHDEGKLTVMPAIGYDHPDQSHFNSRHFYEVGGLQRKLVTGWMGRYLDRVGSMDNPLQGLSMDGDLAPALATARVPVAALTGPEYNFWSPGVWGEVGDWMLEAFPSLGSPHASSSDPALRAAASTAVQAGRLRQQLLPFDSDGDQPAFTSPVTYPESEGEDFPQRLAALAAMIASGLSIRCVAMTAPGDYDTHDSQPDGFGNNLKLAAESLLAFQRDLEARGLADRVLVQVWSEFGRRAEENGSQGTDHGAAGLGMLIGTRASGRMVGEFPGLARLDPDGNLRMTSDFRAVYCSLSEQWLNTDAAAVIPDASRFGRPALVR
ncbi:MAG: DUF1501 domain-containing protein [Solirubrobacterales bacterium]